MQGAVEVLLVIGILIYLVKGADIILRPHQQTWLQQRLDTLALRLDYTKPLEWYKRKTVGNKTWLLICGVIFFTTGVFVSVLFNNPRWGLILIFPGVSALTVELTAHVAQLNRRSERMGIHEPKAISESTEKLITWFIQSGTTAQLIIRPTICALGTALLSIAFQRIVLELASKFREHLREVTTVLVMIYVVFLLLTILRRKFPWQLNRFVFAFRKFVPEFIMVFMGIGAISVIMLISCLLMFIFEFVLQFLRAIVWRIAEYNKGALAAIIVLLTMALGMLEAYLRSRGKW